MARYGVSKEAVFAAANQLVAEGKDPTIEQIRLILKTGSNSTIAAHLRDWRAAQNNSQPDTLNGSIPREMVALMKGLWERLSTQAEMEVTAAETKHQETLAELEQELQKYQANNRRWQRLFLQWQQEREKLLTDKLTLEEKINLLQSDNKVLQTKLETQTEQIQEKRLRIEELHRLHLQFQANHKDYHEQHMLEQSRFEQQIKNYQHELAARQHEYQTLQQHYQELEHRFSRANNELKEQQQEILINKHWQQQYQETQKLLDDKINQLIEAKALSKLAASQLVTAHSTLNSLQEQNQNLEQEKFRLEEELKRMDDAAILAT